MDKKDLESLSPCAKMAFLRCLVEKLSNEMEIKPSKEVFASLEKAKRELRAAQRAAFLSICPNHQKVAAGIWWDN